ncbi:hypothetical protein DSLASN_15430 [Desulfoluna limicola]|uniref:Uncharacterized protein n=1 Tax=Desulfoluna limicola TaxID=2810562 RepID=A0ABM7PFA2_9BACT|nr:hypothetical protein [Desulfoluna limicola]BCS95911.1 hypothetical protein DSLASN_15430 [Desulfoluna limicola]
MLISEHKFTQIATAMESGARIELGATPYDDSLVRAYHDTDLIAECKGTYADLDEALSEMDDLLQGWNDDNIYGEFDV